MAQRRQDESGMDPSIRHVVCIGLMAAARSPLGERLASELGWRVVDVDTEVEARTGQTVAELSYEGGEEAYRPWERQVVVDGLAADEPSVVLAPGGIALDPEARKAIGAVDVVAVYLRADPDALATLAEQEVEHHRPVLGPNPLATLQAMFRDRDATYRALADIEVQVDEHGPDEGAALVLAALTGAPAQPPRAAP